MKHDYEALVTKALTEPGTLSTAYSAFWNYSFGNQLLAYMQRGKAEPINTYPGWQKLGRQVKKGEKAIGLIMPVTIKEEKDGQERTKTIFIERRNWFGLSQTEHIEGWDAYIAPSLPGFDLSTALSTLNITQESFNHGDGNTQGYARPKDKIIAISPLAVDPFKTTCHEIAHCLLHGDQATMGDSETIAKDVKEVEAELTAYLVTATLNPEKDLSSSRAYIQHWNANQANEKARYSKIFASVDAILKAGRTNNKGA